MIELHDITIRSGSFALTKVALSIPESVYAVLMGGTGQGKTTILEAICGLRSVTSGRVLLN
ncbi:MAG: polyamine-transporting ATPase, partial [Planctomycetota bacterium]